MGNGGEKHLIFVKKGKIERRGGREWVCKIGRDSSENLGGNWERVRHNGKLIGQVKSV